MNILFGISGSVSAYKIINLIRLFIKNGYTCKAVLTRGATEFIKPELLVALGCDTLVDVDMLSYDSAMSHINLSRWADKIYIIPASANLIARLSNGFADDLLSQVILANSDNNKVYIAPAMNVNMWNNQFTQSNIEKLLSLDFNIIIPDSGIQACGDIGGGRLYEPEQLFELLCCEQDYKDTKVLITVGATIEDIDGVRYLSNYSSGKMGLSLIKELLIRGAIVTVLKAKTDISFDIKHTHLNIINTKTAVQMNAMMLDKAAENHIFIGCAAVADYRIKDKFDNKIKKTSDNLTLEFIKNPDVLANCKKNFPNIFTIGFAAESTNLEEYAISKLNKKNLDMIVANDTSALGSEQSSIILISNANKQYLDKQDKSKNAKYILDFATQTIGGEL